jgi:C-terminal processing protease CtpA/Prc
MDPAGRIGVMMKKLCQSLLLFLILPVLSLGAQEPRGLFDKEFRKEKLPDLAQKYRPQAEGADSLEKERNVIHRFLSEIPVSHLALYSIDTYSSLVNELKNKKMPTLGFSLVGHDGKLFVHRLLDGGPAHEKGLLRFDRIIEVDGQPVWKSNRLDWRSDDAALPDPPVHNLLCEEGETVTLLVERMPGTAFEVQVTSRRYSGFDAAKASSRIISFQGKRFGYIHFWYIHNTGPSRLLSEKIKGDFSKCDGLVLDLRGRGGSATMVSKMVSTLIKQWHPRPLTVLVDRTTRSAKEVLTYEIKERWLGLIVGERTAGAVIPARFKKVGRDSVLMFPSFTLGQYTHAIEGSGIEPDIPVRDSGPYSAGADPILEAGLLALARGTCRV